MIFGRRNQVSRVYQTADYQAARRIPFWGRFLE